MDLPADSSSTAMQRVRSLVEAVSLVANPSLPSTVDESDVMDCLRLFSQMELDHDYSVSREDFKRCLQAVLGDTVEDLVATVDPVSQTCCLL